MKMQIELQSAQNDHLWDDYVQKHVNANIYHLVNWREIIAKSYGHKALYLSAWKRHNGKKQIRGILPLILIKSKIFGSGLYSLPFFDMGGILADDVETESDLLAEAIKQRDIYGAGEIELRQETDLNPETIGLVQNSAGCRQLFSLREHKVRMVLPLPGSAENLFNLFKSKLRSQIKRPIKAGLYAEISGCELFDDFYKVFAINMRDLGSPVHGKGMIRKVIKAFGDNCRIVVVYLKKMPTAAGIVIGFNRIMMNPWSSAAHQYSKLSPNMLLYWTMLSYACEKGYQLFDFGRSTPGEGTYNFKAQWGAKPKPIKWISIRNAMQNENGATTKDKTTFSKFIKMWKRMPLGLSVLLGPSIRKYINL